MPNVDLAYLSHVGNLFEKTGRCWDLYIKDDFLAFGDTELCCWKSKMCSFLCGFGVSVGMHVRENERMRENERERMK